jgi:hypothetical protein
LYDNGIYKEVITSRDALLKNPGLVNNDAVVSMLSAIIPGISSPEELVTASSAIELRSLELKLRVMDSGALSRTLPSTGLVPTKSAWAAAGIAPPMKPVENRKSEARTAITWVTASGYLCKVKEESPRTLDKPKVRGQTSF